MCIATKGILLAYILLKIINSNLNNFSRAGEQLFHVPKDLASNLRANTLYNLSWKKQTAKQCVLFSRQMYEYTEIVKHSCQVSKVNALCCCSKASAEKTTVSSQACLQVRLLFSPVLFLKTLAELPNLPNHSHFQIRLFFTISNL